MSTSSITLMDAALGLEDRLDAYLAEPRRRFTRVRSTDGGDLPGSRSIAATEARRRRRIAARLRRERALERAQRRAGLVSAVAPS